jgi:hypothetical protein
VNLVLPVLELGYVIPCVVNPAGEKFNAFIIAISALQKWVVAC